MYDVFTTKYAQDIFLQKYSMNGQETWSDMSKRVVAAVCGQLLSQEDQEEIYKIINKRLFIPGGRYLYSAGRAYHNVNNCFLFKAEDSREGWGELVNKASVALMSGGGIGVDYSAVRGEGELIKKTGGTSSGTIGLMNMVNEIARHIMAGGYRRSAVWAGLQWDHRDINSFLNLKNHPESLKELKRNDLRFALPMELTNISVIYNTEFFVAMENQSHPKHNLALEVWKNNCLQAFSTAEPGFSFNFCKDNESTRNACQPNFASIKTEKGNKLFKDLKIGDAVDNGYGEYTKVINKWSTGVKPVSLYVLDDFSCFIGTNDHNVVVLKNNEEIKMPIKIAEFFNLPIKTSKGYGFISYNIYLGDHEVFDITVEHEKHTYNTGGVIVSNCTEVVSEDDSDKCNLGTVWVNRIKDKKELRHVIKYATKFLLCGGVYSDVPTQKIREVGNKNNRIGLGLGGLHEWLMLRGNEYVVTPELHKWLSIYEQESDASSFIFSKELNVPIPKGKRAIAPTGTIGILAETTTGIEPLFCKSYKRRYLKGKDWHYQYVVDGSVKRLLDQGVDINKIKDSYDISFKQRVKFQADVQNYVDMAISSTCNLPSWGTGDNNDKTLDEYSKILLKYAKRLRGFTCYPDGCRTGQPLERVDLETAMSNEGVVFQETETECIGGVCGI